MKVEFELEGWFPEMVKALKQNRQSTSDYSRLCKTMIESWLIEHEDSFKEEFEKLKESHSFSTVSEDEI